MWTARGACPDFHSLLSRTSTSVAPSLTSSRARVAFTVGRMRPPWGPPQNGRGTGAGGVGFWAGVGVVVKVSSIRPRQDTAGGISSEVRPPASCQAPAARLRRGWRTRPLSVTVTRIPPGVLDLRPARWPGAARNVIRCHLTDRIAPMKIVVVGGVAAGMSAAARARRLDEFANDDDLHGGDP